MQRYHFDLVDRENAMGVTEHDDDEQAMKVAPKLAPELRLVRPELIGQGCEILIGTRRWRRVWRVSVDQLPGPST